MKTIGLIGGMSWKSSLEYYRIINKLVMKKMGGLHSAKCILYSVDFDTIEKLYRKNDWMEIKDTLTKIARSLESAGADLVAICTNTMHKIADSIQRSISIPLINIIDATAERIRDKGIEKVGLLGTEFTMKDEFYRNRLRKFGIEVTTPNERDIKIVDRIIFDELCKGVIDIKSKREVNRIIKGMISTGIEGVILGCTELPLLIKQRDVDVPIFDTTRIHAETIVRYAIEE